MFERKEKKRGYRLSSLEKGKKKKKPQTYFNQIQQIF